MEKKHKNDIVSGARSGPKIQSQLLPKCKNVHGSSNGQLAHCFLLRRGLYPPKGDTALTASAQAVPALTATEMTISSTPTVHCHLRGQRAGLILTAAIGH